VSAQRGRADRLYPGLTARQRAKLVSKALNAGRRIDERIYRTMPRDQVSEFKEHMALVRCVDALFPYMLLLEQQVRNVEALLALLATLRQWSADRADLLDYVFLATDEPCSAEEYEAYRAAARAEELRLKWPRRSSLEAVRATPTARRCGKRRRSCGVW
jgi:hypothetical protein